LSAGDGAGRSDHVPFPPSIAFGAQPGSPLRTGTMVVQAVRRALNWVIFVPEFGDAG
jgi:hypothetical protein